ncbi:putative Protein MKS1 [Zostera marina]|uniref:VQ domain-containing protein n=1 Tax=Zostera marina TaxID=29655 RepID=A0A0K9P9A9_ZOSMR|nr:putative Protein MKS1 [Zostera marina]
MDSSLSRLYQEQQYQLQQQQQYQIQQAENILITPRPLQGPRPTPLSVRKDSYKIKKPPTAPVLTGQTQQQPPSQQQRQPVIIYTVSPKVIHTKPGDFRSLVQHLTGVNSSPSTTAIAAATGINPISPVGFPSPLRCGGMSPAAKLATIEKAQYPTDHSGMSRELAEELNIGEPYNDTGEPSSAAQVNMLGILSPNPASLPSISPNLFSSNLNSLGFLDMINFSPNVPINKNYVDNTFLHSPFTPNVQFPNWDLFGELLLPLPANSPN